MATAGASAANGHDHGSGAAPLDARADDDALLRGHKFYLSRQIGPARRHELQTLIKCWLFAMRCQNNGGVVEKGFTPGTVELVESDRLKIGAKWVSVDFVYDSVRDQVLQDVHQYMAAADAHEVARQRNERIGDGSKRRGKVPYTTADEAKMLQFVVNHFKGSWKWEDSVPESAWAIAAAKGDEENARQRRELSKKNATASEPPSAGHPAAPSAPEDAAPVVITSTEAAASLPPHSQPAAHETSGANETSSQHDKAPRVKPVSSLPHDEETEGESIQGRHKKKRKRVRKSAAEKKRSLEEARVVAGGEMASAPLDSAVRENSRTSFIRPPPKEATPEKGKTSLPPSTTDESIKPPPKATTPERDQTAVQATTTASEPMKKTSATSLETASPASTRQQNEQDMTQTSPSAQKRAADDGAVVPTEDDAATSTSLQAQERTDDDDEARAEGVPATEATSPQTTSAASSERPIGGIFFRSRWAELINDPANRKQLDAYCTLNRQQMPPSRASQKNWQSAKQRATSEVASTKDSAASSRGKKRRMGAVADDNEESKEQERQAKTRQTNSAAEKKRKVQRTEAQNKAPSTTTSATGEIRQKAPVQREIVDVTSDTEIDELIYQIQFETTQDLASVTHALYYCSGDVEVTTKFLNGEFPSDVWSPEDDLVLVDFMDPAVDSSRIAEAQRTGVFSKMRVRRSVEQILTRIQYLL
ncbi:hypothetical protein FI667_g5097, partial [Globisporangium splendens]